MVRRWSVVACVVLALLLTIGAAGQAHADTVYNEGTISTTYLEYARGVVAGKMPADSYVFFRGGQYNYTLIVSDNLKHEDGRFVADTFTRFTWTVSSGYNTVPTYDVSIGSAFSLNSGSTMVYSNLGDYPSLEDGGVIYGQITAVLLAVLLLGGLARSLFDAVYSLRR